MWQYSDYPAYGNKNMAGKMTNVDLTNPSYVTQGPGLTTLTDGDENGNVDTLISTILDKAQKSDTSYAAGEDTFYIISSSAVTSTHTVSGTNVNIEDIVYYQGDVYYSWYDDSTADIGKYDVSAGTYDDDWGTDVAGAGPFQGVPLPLEEGGDDKFYMGQANFVSSYDGSTWDADALDLPDNCEIQDLKWVNNRLYIAANSPAVSGTNKEEGSIFIWDTVSNSWTDEITIKGGLSSLYVKNGVLYVFYKDDSCHLGIVQDNQIKYLCDFEGTLPSFGQITNYRNYIIWVGDDKIYAYGTPHPQLSPMLFQMADGGYSNVGALASPFETPMVASSDGSVSYKIAKFSDYTTNSSWKSICFDASNMSRGSQLERLIFNFETLKSDARVDWNLKDNGGNTISSGIISYANDGAVNNKRIRLGGAPCSNFRIELDWSNGDTTNPVKIKSIKIKGHSYE